MKKTLLITAAACLALSATAATPLLPKKQTSKLETSISSRIEKAAPVRELKSTAAQPRHAKAEAAEEGPVNAFTGETSLYVMESFVEGYYDSDIAVKLQIDGNEVLISGLDGGILGGNVPVRGTIEGNVITIPAQKVFNQYDYGYGLVFDVYISKLSKDETGAIVTDEEGYAMFTGEPYQLIIQEDGTIMDADIEIDPLTQEITNVGYFGIFADLAHEGMGEREFFTYNCGIVLTPYAGTAAVTLPEGAVAEDYYFNYTRSGVAYSEIEQAYQDGEDFYLQGLTVGSGAWLKGTVANGKLHVPSGQFLGEDFSYLMTFQAITNLTTDEEGYVDGYDVLPELTFTIDETGKYVLDEGQYAGLVYLQSQLLGVCLSDITFSKFEGLTAAIPSAPEFRSFSDLTSSYGQYGLAFLIPETGTKGEFLDINNLEWAIYVDDEVYEFNQETGYFVSEPMTWFPASEYVDEAGGYDIQCSDGYVQVYIYQDLYEAIGIQSRYTFEDKTYYSDINYIGLTPYEAEDGNMYYPIYTVEVENEPIDDPVSIKAVNAAMAQRLFDLSGRRVQAQKGLVINNGEVRFVK